MWKMKAAHTAVGAAGGVLGVDLTTRYGPAPGPGETDWLMLYVWATYGLGIVGLIYLALLKMRRKS